MKHTIRTYFLAAALLLLGAATLAGCSQTDDTLPAGTEVAQGGEPLNIRIAPKPGYMESTNTRATVNDETGAFAWEAGDHIIVFVTFNDAAATTVKSFGSYNPGNTASYLPDWDMVGIDGMRPISKLTWPLGASSATVTAIHSNALRYNGFEGTGFCCIKFGDDYMRFSKTVVLGDDLTIDFAHLTTRLVFTGLSANTEYTLKVNGVVAKYPIYIDHDNLTPIDYQEHSFTTDASGNLTVCASLDAKLDANGQVKLELVTGGVTVYETTLAAQGTAGAYKMDGYIYKIKVADGGKVNPDSFPDLLFPEPIVAGNTVWELNGYYITAPDADIAKTYQWSADASATVMDNDPCAGHGNWRMPSMTDFEALLGTLADHLWTGEDALETPFYASDKDKFLAAFPGGGYLSSEVRTTNSSEVYYLNSYGSGNVKYSTSPKAASVLYIRCVTKQ